MAAITQPITVTVFNRGNRQAGVYLTNTATIPEGIYSIGLTDTLTDADASNPALTFTLTLAVSPDGAVWQDVFRQQWQGGTYFHKQLQALVPNHVNWAWSDHRLASGAWLGWQARGTLVQDVTMRLGLDLTAYPPDFNPT